MRELIVPALMVGAQAGAIVGLTNVLTKAVFGTGWINWTVGTMSGVAMGDLNMSPQSQRVGGR